jgi:hypothetical protein
MMSDDSNPENQLEKPTPPCSLTEMLSEIDAGSDAIYAGPGAYTMAELRDQSPFKDGAVRERAREQVVKGNWVEVKVQRITPLTGKANYPIAFVKQEVYDEWMTTKGGVKKPTKGDTKKLKVDINV